MILTYNKVIKSTSKIHCNIEGTKERNYSFIWYMVAECKILLGNTMTTTAATATNIVQATKYNIELCAVNTRCITGSSKKQETVNLQG